MCVEVSVSLVENSSALLGLKSKTNMHNSMQHELTLIDSKTYPAAKVQKHASHASQ